MSNYSLRNVDEKTAWRLRAEAERDGISLNAALLRALRRGLGLEHEAPRSTYRDLSGIAGTWSANDVERFRRDTAVFEQVDEDMWS